MSMSNMLVILILMLHYWCEKGTAHYPQHEHYVSPNQANHMTDTYSQVQYPSSYQYPSIKVCKLGELIVQLTHLIKSAEESNPRWYPQIQTQYASQHLPQYQSNAQSSTQILQSSNPQYNPQYSSDHFNPHPSQATSITTVASSTNQYSPQYVSQNSNQHQNQRLYQTVSSNPIIQHVNPNYSRQDISSQLNQHQPQHRSHTSNAGIPSSQINEGLSLEHGSHYQSHHSDYQPLSGSMTSNEGISPSAKIVQSGTRTPKSTNTQYNSQAVLTSLNQQHEYQTHQHSPPNEHSLLTSSGQSIDSGVNQVIEIPKTIRFSQGSFEKLSHQPKDPTISNLVSHSSDKAASEYISQPSSQFGNNNNQQNVHPVVENLDLTRGISGIPRKLTTASSDNVGPSVSTMKEEACEEESNSSPERTFQSINSNTISQIESRTSDSITADNTGFSSSNSTDILPGDGFASDKSAVSKGESEIIGGSKSSTANSFSEEALNLGSGSNSNNYAGSESSSKIRTNFSINNTDVSASSSARAEKDLNLFGNESSNVEEPEPIN